MTLSNKTDGVERHAILSQVSSNIWELMSGSIPELVRIKENLWKE